MFPEFELGENYFVAVSFEGIIEKDLLEFCADGSPVAPEIDNFHRCSLWKTVVLHAIYRYT